MSLVFDIPGARMIELTDLMVDVNGTLTNRGELIDGVRPRLQKLAAQCAIHLVSADTFGTLDGLAASLGVGATRVSNGLCGSITEALELLADPRALAATLRP
jgi:soluble P-type ATPase